MRRSSLWMTLSTLLSAMCLLILPPLVALYFDVRNPFIYVLIFLTGLVCSTGAAVVIALRQSRKISAPLIYVAASVEQLGSATTRPAHHKSGIEEIDLVYDEVDRAADRIAGRISAERRFAADASHQLRTPLTSLSMRLEEIDYLTDDRAVKEEITHCLEQVDRLTHVVQSLLENAQQQAARGEAVKVEKIFAQQNTEWHRAFKDTGRKLEFKPGTHGPVLCNPSALSQIVATLIENSLHYGEGTTTVTSVGAGHTAVISVADEGAGVKDEFVDAIFAKGFSLGGSTGFGLSIAKELAMRNGGRLELTSARPPVFSLILSALPAELSPEKVLPAGGVIAVSARKRRF